ncbi:hypothetical protein UT300019_06410 [Clostridium sp. CTA-19]
MQDGFESYNKLSFRKKKIIIFLLIIIFIAIWIFTSRYIAKKTIFDYMDRQGISRNDIVVEDFIRDWKCGGYIYDVAVKGEDPDIYYEYHYYNDKSIRFAASRMNAQWIKEKTWGGNYLDSSDLESLKYPPLKD